MDVSWWVLVMCMYGPKGGDFQESLSLDSTLKKSQIPTPGARGLIARVSVGSHQWCITQRANLNRGARNSTLGVLVPVILLLRIQE